LALDSLDLARNLFHALEEKKGEKILLLDIRMISTFTDYFIICNGTSDRMIDSLAEEVIKVAKEKNGIQARIEGKALAGWVLLDLGDVIVHLFSPDQRQFYRLEQLWEEGRVLLHLQ